MLEQLRIVITYGRKKIYKIDTRNVIEQKKEAYNIDTWNLYNKKLLGP